MRSAYIGIGSNLGNREENIQISLKKISSRNGVELKKVSSITETAAMGIEPQPKFLNAVCCVETSLYPDELLVSLQVIEREMGRKKTGSSIKLRTDEQLRMVESGEISIDDITNLTKEKEEDNVTKKSLYTPRNIDLDILFYGDVIIKGFNLVIPHPRLHERLFVLEPMAEIAPDFVHPIFKKTVKELLTECQKKDEADT